MKKKIMTFSFLIILILTLAACNSKKTERNQNDNTGKLTIYTTIYPIQFITEKIGGKHVATENIIPPGSDAHSIEIKTKTMIKVAESDAFIHTGTGLEGFVDSISDTVKKEDVLIVNVTENINLLSPNGESGKIEEGHDDHGEELDVDPHFWLDPKRSLIAAENVKNALVQLAPRIKKYLKVTFQP